MSMYDTNKSRRQTELLGSDFTSLSAITYAEIEPRQVGSATGMASVGQQVSVHAARSIWLRLEAAVPSMEPAAFLALGDELGTFDRVVMNPPFGHGADIEHIKHAYRKLKPGGRLVAICANGPRQQEVMGEICSAWIELPAGSFKEQGTNVNAAIVVLDN